MKKTLAIVVAVMIVLCSMQPITFLKAQSAQQAMEISTMKVNSLTAPIGIDTTPIFSWTNVAEGFNRSMSAYRIIVASTRENAIAGNGDLWDSGKVISDKNFDVLYEGTALESRTEYFWQVFVYDENDNLFESEISTFETGMLNESDWTAQWIGGSVTEYYDLSSAKWIWANETQKSIPTGTKYFRYTFTPQESKTVSAIYLGGTADDSLVAYYNGTQVASCSNWQSGMLVELTDKTATDKNVIAVKVDNAYTSTGSYAGLLLQLEVRYTDGTVEKIGTSKAWKLSDTEVSQWQNLDFDDSSWINATEHGDYNASPWSAKTKVKIKHIKEDVSSAPMLRKEFKVTKEIEKARMYICGLGLFELKINGVLPDDSVLNPANTQYERAVNYCVFDVTKLLTSGGNAIAVELGNSFYNEDFTLWNTSVAVWRDEPKLIAQLHVTYADGTEDVIVSDTSWKLYLDGPMVFDSIYYGEEYDARLEVEDWAKASFDDSQWINAVSAKAPGTGNVNSPLKFQDMEPMRRIKTHNVTISRLDNGNYVVKTPVVTTGWAKITFNGLNAGDIVKITYGEKLKSDGSVHKVFWGEYTDRPFQVLQYIAKGGAEETYEPKFTYCGYQYIEIEGYNGTLTADDIECYLIASDVESVSTFDSSNELINTLHENMRRALINNFQGKPTDCPTYEKLGWLGDYNVVIRSAMFNYGVSAFNSHFMEVIRDTAKSSGDHITNFAPCAEGGYNHVIWTAAYTEALYEAWRYYGNLNDIQDHYTLMRKTALDYVAQIKDETTSSSGVTKYAWLWAYAGNLGDWQAPDGPSGAPEGTGVVGTAMVYGVLDNMAKMADALGYTSDAEEYRGYMVNIYNAFNEHFYNAEKGYYESLYWNTNNAGTRTKYRQTSNLVAVYYGLCPDDRLESVVKSIADDVTAKGVHLDTGYIGTRCLLPVLSENGYEELAYSVLTQTTYPSWGYWVTQGATSCWEGYPLQGTRSHNHYFLGTYDQWLFENLLGFEDFNEGFSTVTVKPQLMEDLTYVNGSVKTVRGTLSNSLKKYDDGTLDMTVEVPIGTTATIYVPATDINKLSVNGKKLSEQNGISSYEVEGKYVKVTTGSGKYQFKTDINFAEVLENLALNKTVTASKSISSPGWWADANVLIDGDRNNYRASDKQNIGWSSAMSDASVYLQIDLGNECTFNTVDIYGTGATGANKLCRWFPKSYLIQVSDNGSEWETVYTATNVPQPYSDAEGNNPAIRHEFDAVTARYIRVQVTALNDKYTTAWGSTEQYAQLAEIEVYYDASAAELNELIKKAEKLSSADYTVTGWKKFSDMLNEAKNTYANGTVSEKIAATKKLNAAMTELKKHITSNIAVLGSITASKSISSPARWADANVLIDGDRNNYRAADNQNIGWSSAMSDASVYLQIDFGEEYTFNTVDIYGTGVTGANKICRWFPKGYLIQVSNNGSEWETVYTATNVPQPYSDADGNNPAIRHEFDAVTARYIRVQVTALNDKYTTAWGSTEQYVQLAEIEVYNIRKSIVGATIDIGASLTINYYVADMLTENDFMRFTSSSGRVTEVNGEYDETMGYYKFAYTGINPQCMGDNINAELISETTVLDTVSNYSVEQYCLNQSGKTAAELGLNEQQREKLLVLLADMLVYGGEAQIYKNYNTDNIVSDNDIVASYASTFVVPEGVRIITGNKDTNNQVTAVGVNMSNVNKIYFKIKITDNVTIKLNGKEVDKSTLAKNDDGIYLLYSDGIKATQFDNVFTLQIVNNDIEITKVEYNVNAYVQAKYNTPIIENIVKALSNYGRSAKNYKGSFNDKIFDLEEDEL